MKKNFFRQHEKTSEFVDVVADANYGTVSETYNLAFRKWRSDPQNDYAFQCQRDGKQAIYVEGKGYHLPDPAAEERSAMLRVNVVLGFAMLCYLLLENLSIYVLILAVKLFGLDVSYNHSDGALYGPEVAVLVILILQAIVKYLVPLLIFRKMFHMPRCVAFRIKPYVKREIPITISIALIVFAITNLWTLFTPVNVLSFSTLGAAYYAVSYMSPPCQIIYLIAEVVIVSVMSELMLHGEILHVLRQFGDWYAVLMTALLAVCVSHSYVTVMMEFTFAIVTGISVLRSGSLLSSIFSRVLYHVLLFAFFWLRIVPNIALSEHTFLLMLSLLLLGFLGCAAFMRTKKNDPALLTQKHYLTPRERMRTLIQTGPLSIIFGLCIALMLIEVIF